MATFDMRPKALIDELGLLAPIYRATSNYGHFGRADFAWEKTDRAARITDDLLRATTKVARVNGTSAHKKPGARKRGAAAVA
jgi:S-adenosylmethionine synthetase